MMMTFPHCDARILHAPGECAFCDEQPSWQELREAWGIAFTGHAPAGRQMACPADAARPQGSPGDHRRWGGNKPTSATGDASWPQESAASQMMYGDKGGRKECPPEHMHDDDGTVEGCPGCFWEPPEAAPSLLKRTLTRLGVAENKP